LRLLGTSVYVSFSLSLLYQQNNQQMQFRPLTQFGQNVIVQFFHDFASKYSDAMPEANQVFPYWESSQSIVPFEIIEQTVVCFNQTKWRELGFTNDELEAMLAHEIGHAVDTLPRTDDTQSERENNADDFAIAHNFGSSLCSALKKCISSGIYNDQEVEGMKTRVTRIRHESLNNCCYLLRGVHSEPKNEWLIAINDHWEEILNTPLMADRVQILKNLASQIKGIGPTTIDETLTWFDD